MTRFFSVCMMFFLPAVPLLSQDVTVTARVDSQSIAIGDWIRYSVTVTHPASVEVMVPSFRDSIGAFDIVGQDSLIRTDENGKIGLSKKFVLTQFDAGTHSIPPFTVSFLDAAGNLQTAQSNPIPVEVRGVEVDTTQAIRDVKPQLTVPMSAEEIALYVAIALALAGAGYGLYYYVKKRKRDGAAAEDDQPQIPPHILALLRLDELESKGLWKKGEVKLFYSDATEIVRRYFEQRYGIMALEMTSGEVMAQLKKCPIPLDLLSVIERFLTDADLVKFAKYQPAAPENEHVIPSARGIVEQTKPEETAPSAEVTQGTEVQHG